MSAPVIEFALVPDTAPPYDGDPRSGTATAPPPAAAAVPCPSAPPTDDWPNRFARILTEIVTGSRPHRQIVPLTSERARSHLRRIAPSFAGGGLPRVLRVLTTSPAPDVTEATVILSCGQRARALALRFERAQGRWICTDIEAA